MYTSISASGIPINTSSSNVGLGREFELPPRTLSGHWQIAVNRPHGSSRLMALPITSGVLNVSGPQQVNVYHSPLDKVEAR